MQILRALGFGLLVLVGLGVVAVVLAPQSDGPMGPLPGGPLQSGTPNRGAVADWSFAADEETIELQLVSQDRSRTTWILVRDGAGYIPCSLGFPPGKSWHQHALRSGDARIRIDGRIYAVRLEKIESEVLSARLVVDLADKYDSTPPGDAGIWFFRLHDAE